MLTCLCSCKIKQHVLLLSPIIKTSTCFNVFACVHVRRSNRILCLMQNTSYCNINWKGVQRKYVVNNVDMSNLRAYVNIDVKGGLSIVPKQFSGLKWCLFVFKLFAGIFSHRGCACSKSRKDIRGRLKARNYLLPRGD